MGSKYRSSSELDGDSSAVRVMVADEADDDDEEDEEGEKDAVRRGVDLADGGINTGADEMGEILRLTS